MVLELQLKELVSCIPNDKSISLCTRCAKFYQSLWVGGGLASRGLLVEVPVRTKQLQIRLTAVEPTAQAAHLIMQLLHHFVKYYTKAIMVYFTAKHNTVTSVL